MDTTERNLLPYAQQFPARFSADDQETLPHPTLQVTLFIERYHHHHTDSANLYHFREKDLREVLTSFPSSRVTPYSFIPTLSRCAPPTPFSFTSGPFHLRLISHHVARYASDATTRDTHVGDPDLRIRPLPRSYHEVFSRAPAEMWIDTSSSGTSSAPGSAAPKFFIRDESSFGTFLNPIRLGPAGQDSCPYRLKDGDLLQLVWIIRGERGNLQER
ncbi:hypothetical protein BDP27DRAFT_1428387 [Rhodocollybia butyracea]|uniref:FHA domain-containing protein n=1 Tax=Rhodocollybia butyracea TaxID=206335 RepID=A0A9P5PEL3_9AGAR|nr:hypothetical protein BDP27DRAFT_1428387 [Rhodocollybia butyracea]